eukprot:9471967-Pyramimonas_sp.AAC.1
MDANEVQSLVKEIAHLRSKDARLDQILQQKEETLRILKNEVNDLKAQEQVEEAAGAQPNGFVFLRHLMQPPLARDLCPTSSH